MVIVRHIVIICNGIIVVNYRTHVYFFFFVCKEKKGKKESKKREN